MTKNTHTHTCTRYHVPFFFFFFFFVPGLSGRERARAPSSSSSSSSSARPVTPAIMLHNTIIIVLYISRGFPPPTLRATHAFSVHSKWRKYDRRTYNNRRLPLLYIRLVHPRLYITNWCCSISFTFSFPFVAFDANWQYCYVILVTLYYVERLPSR